MEFTTNITHLACALVIFTLIKGLSVLSVFSLLMSHTVSIPFVTLPNTVCLLSSQGHATTVMKNCDPFVFGPRFAIASI